MNLDLIQKTSRSLFFALSLFSLVFLCGTGCKKKAEESVEQIPTSQVSPVPEGSANPSPSATSATASTEATSTNAAGPDLTADSNGLSKAVVVVKTSKGAFKFKFYPKEAPNTVKRFVELVQQKFFDGQSFHRVVPGFVVQTGDPKSKNKSDPTVGSGGSGKKLNAEFNSRKHVRGTVAMARASDENSADSQFYVCLSSYPHLDEKYTVFGQVVEFGEKSSGKDVLDRLVVSDDVVSIHIE